MTRYPGIREATVSTISIGDRAETAAAEYLASEGYEIVERNYRRKYCEIDIVARRDDCMYFVEVKYRRTDSYGGGMDYVDARKLGHMQRAAEIWTAERRWTGDYCLSAIAIGGPQYEVVECIESIY